MDDHYNGKAVRFENPTCVYFIRILVANKSGMHKRIREIKNDKTINKVAYEIQ